MTKEDVALGFVHPATQEHGGVPPMGLAGTPQGTLGLAHGDEAVRQAIILLLLTVPGERVMRPEYGCSLNRLIFSPNDATTAGLAQHYVRQAVERWEPRVELLDVAAGRADEGEVRDGRKKADPHVLMLRLTYRVLATRTVDEVELRVDLSGGELP